LRKIGKMRHLLTSMMLLTFIFTLISSNPKAYGATVKFDATVDQNQLTVDDNVTLTLTVSSDGAVNDDEPTLPELGSFEVLNKWSQSESSSVFVNGKFQFIRKQIYKYTLQPQKPGSIVIGPAEVVVKGSSLKTKPITITVLASGAKPQGGNIAKNRNRKGAQGQPKQPSDEDMQNNPLGGLLDDEDMDSFAQLLKRRGLIPDGRGGIKGQPANDRDAFFISVDVDKSKVYVGEEIIATWSLYTRGAIQAYDSLKYPDLKYFIKEELELANRLNFQSEVVNGIPYQKALLVSYALFPVNAGKKLIDTFKAKATILEMNSAMSVFGMGRPYEYTKSSKEIPIEVLPLPTQGRPDNFSGAVGKFHITGSVSATQVKANQPFSLKIRFQGRGNVRAIELPPLNLPSTVEIYDTKKESQFSKSGDGFQEFEVLLIPRAAGELTIPSIPMSYFDPQAVKYVSQNTPAFQVKVLPGDSTAPGISIPLSQNDSGVTNPSVKQDIHYLKTSSSFDFPPKLKKIFWTSMFTLLAAFFVSLFVRLARFDPTDLTNAVKKRVREKMKIARAKLKLGDSKGVGVECTNAVLATLGEVIGVGAGSLIVDDLVKRLPENSDNLKNEIKNFLNLCEILSFAPTEMSKAQSSEGDLKTIVSKAEKIISQLFEL